MNKNLSILLLVLAAGCSGTGRNFDPLNMDPKRSVSEQDCSRAVDIGTGAGNLKCKGRDLEAERRAQIEEERQAKARAAAAERAARERAARERAEQLAREEAARQARAAEEEAARKARAAEEERLAAERRRLEEEAASKAREERERLAREEAEARARQLAEQQAREAAERERRRLDEGRALLTRFIEGYGKVEEFKEVADPITTFLDKTKDVKR